LFVNEEFLDLFSQNELAEIALENSADETVKTLENKIKEKVARKNFYALAIKPETAEVTVVIEEAAGPQATPLQNKTTPETTLSEPPKEPASIKQPTLAINPEAEKINQKIQRGQQIIKPQQSLDRLMHTQVRTERYLNPSTMPNWQKLLFIAGAWTKKTGSQTFKFSRQAVVYLYNLAKKQTLALVSRISKAKAKNQPVNQSPTQPTEFLIKNEEAAKIEEIKEDILSIFERDLFFNEELEQLLLDDEPEQSIYGIQPEQLAEQLAPEADFDLLVEEEILINTVDQKLEMESEPAGIIASPIKSGSSTLAGKINDFLNGQIVAFLGLKKTQQIIVVTLVLLIFVFAQSVVMIGRSAEAANGTLGYDKITQQIEDQLNSAEAQNIFSDEAGALAAIQKARELLQTIPDKRTTKKLKQDWLDKIETANRNLQRISYQGQPATVVDFGVYDKTLIGLAKSGKVFWTFNNTNKTLLKFDTLTNKLETATSSLPTLKKLASLDATHLIALTKANELYKINISDRAAAPIKAVKEYFLIKNVPNKSLLIQPSLASSTIEMSMPNDNYQLFLNSGHSRIVVLDKAGSLKRQFVSPILTSSTAFAANFTEKKIWFLAEGKVYQLEIDF
jgi:hypothetical protein